MKFCPMCGSSQSDIKATVCWLCDYEEKPYEELSEEEFSELMMPYEYEKIDDGVRIVAVKNARSLRGSVAVPNFVTEIAAHAFADCKFLARIALPKGIRSIGDGAFAHCRDLFDVFIPESVSYIGKSAFSDCYDLGVICCAASEQPSGWDSEWLSGCDAKIEWSSIEE